MADTMDTNGDPFLGLYKNEVGIVYSYNVLKTFLMKNSLRNKLPQNLPGKVYFISVHNTVRELERFKYTVVDDEDVIRIQQSIKKKTTATLGIKEGATLATPIVKKQSQGCKIFYGIMFYSVDDAWEVASKFEVEVNKYPHTFIFKIMFM